MRTAAYDGQVPRQARLARRWAALSVILAVGGAAPALAHEQRASGGFDLVVGWGEEPAYTGVMNSVEVTVSEAGAGAPVTDLGDALQVEVSKGSDTITLPLEAVAPGVSGAAGTYRAWLIPTRPGTYTFRLTGSIRGQDVGESFTSSASTFDDVEHLARIQFPAQDPSTGQLATRIDREVPRLNDRNEALEAGLRRARTIAVVGAVAGVVGLVTAAGVVVAVSRTGPQGGRGREVRAKARGSDRDSGIAEPVGHDDACP
jgi:hypothetical protein